MFKYLKILVIILFLFNANIALAGNGPIVPQGEIYNTGNYALNDLVKMGINVTQIILGIIGSLALLMFVYGGFMMLISAGNNEKVTKAKDILLAAVVGIVIVFTSYIIIKFVMSALGLDWEGVIKTPTIISNSIPK